MFILLVNSRKLQHVSSCDVTANALCCHKMEKREQHMAGSNLSEQTALTHAFKSLGRYSTSHFHLQPYRQRISCLYEFGRVPRDVGNVFLCMTKTKSYFLRNFGANATGTSVVTCSSSKCGATYGALFHV